ncbi:MAG: hypothetical protein J6M02_05750 [Clostridia bacterium]|nr:hypothetical protein [Clostridia bacterium]
MKMYLMSEIYFDERQVTKEKLISLAMKCKEDVFCIDNGKPEKIFDFKKYCAKYEEFRIGYDFFDSKEYTKEQIKKMAIKCEEEAYRITLDENGEIIEEKIYDPYDCFN